jgi:RNA polymerase sigma-70 factor (ECF subfamily)
MDDVERYFDEHAQPLFRYLVRLTGDADLANDAVQSAFMRLVERGSIRGVERAWLYTVATNSALEELRSSARHRRVLAANPWRAPMADPPRDPQERVEGADRATRAREALMSLSEKERSALLMREEGFSHREIADSLATTTGSVGTLIARALIKFAEALPAGSEGA